LYVSVQLKVSGDYENPCNTTSPFITYYMMPGDTVFTIDGADGHTIYTDEALTTEATLNIYTDGTNGFQLIEGGSYNPWLQLGPCPTTTTTTTASPTTTTTTTVAPTTTTTTTASTVPEWYQITNCTTLATATTAEYTVGAYSINERVQDGVANIYTITATYSTNPGGAGLFISSLGATGCPSGTTTTTTTLAPSVATNILVQAVNTSGPDQDCLGTPYSVTVTTVTATLYDQYGATMNVVGSPITVVVNATYNPCYGGSTPTTYNIVIPVGDDGASVNWDSSRTVDCGASNCILETTTYDCAFSNTASLPWRSGTISC
jgi:hypothetical protein